MTEIELFGCFNIDMTKYMKKKAKMGENIWLWTISPIKPHTLQSAKNTTKIERRKRIEKLRKFYSYFGRFHISPFVE